MAVGLGWMVTVCAVLAVGAIVHRDLARIGEALARPTGQADVEPRLDEFWDAVVNLQGDHAKRLDDRVAGLETTVAQSSQGQSELARHVRWMTSWVQHWAGSTAGEQPR